MQLLKKIQVPVSISRLVYGRILIIFIPFAIVFAFDNLAFVNLARSYFPTQLHETCGCSCVLNGRPWYGQINPWTWLWWLLTPVSVFSINPKAPSWFRILFMLLMVLISYAVLVIATLKSFDIINAPFIHSEISQNSSSLEIFKFECYDKGDSGPRTFAALFGWIPGLIYYGCWELLYLFYYIKIRKSLFGVCRVDKFLIMSSVIIPVTFIVLLLLKWAYKFL